VYRCCAYIFICCLDGNVVSDTMVDNSCTLITEISGEAQEHLSGYDCGKSFCCGLHEHSACDEFVNWHDEEGAKG
jgi:hypothetical protein